MVGLFFVVLVHIYALALPRHYCVTVLSTLVCNVLLSVYGVGERRLVTSSIGGFSIYEYLGSIVEVVRRCVVLFVCHLDSYFLCCFHNYGGNEERHMCGIGQSECSLCFCVFVVVVVSLFFAG